MPSSCVQSNNSRRWIYCSKSIRRQTVSRRRVSRAEQNKKKASTERMRTNRRDWCVTEYEKVIARMKEINWFVFCTLSTDFARRVRSNLLTCHRGRSITRAVLLLRRWIHRHKAAERLGVLAGRFAVAVRDGEVRRIVVFVRLKLGIYLLDFLVAFKHLRHGRIRRWPRLELRRGR